MLVLCKISKQILDLYFHIISCLAVCVNSVNNSCMSKMFYDCMLYIYNHHTTQDYASVNYEQYFHSQQTPPGLAGHIILRAHFIAQYPAIILDVPQCVETLKPVIAF